MGVALKMNNNAIAIIGGADGPTSVFVAGKLNSVLEMCIRDSVNTDGIKELLPELKRIGNNLSLIHI